MGYGTGKSLALMYAVNIARSMRGWNGQWICLYCPNTHDWVQKIKLTVPANDREAVFYQHDYAREFFQNLKKAGGDKLKQIPLSNEYKIVRPEDGLKGTKVDLEMVYAMLEVALSKDCRAPASLMYDFVDEMRKQKQF